MRAFNNKRVEQAIYLKNLEQQYKNLEDKSLINKYIDQACEMSDRKEAFNVIKRNTVNKQREQQNYQGRTRTSL